MVVPGQNQLLLFFTSLAKEIVTVSLMLFRIMIPVIIVIRILEELGLIVYLSQLLAPVMGIVGLPESMGLVWATTMVTNIYGGMIIFFNAAETTPLTIAQATIIGGMMLVAHSMPIEVRIAQKAGVRLAATLVLRIVGAVIYGLLLNGLYSAGDWLQTPHQMSWIPEQVDTSWLGWGITQLKNIGIIFLIIAALITLLRILKILHIERLLHVLLQPVLRLLGIGHQATNVTIIGMTLGLSIGGGLLINEARQGHILPKDIFSSMGLLGLCHSIIEDTLLILLLGADISGVLWLRLVFGVLVVAIIFRLLERCSDSFKNRFLYQIKHPS